MAQLFDRLASAPAVTPTCPRCQQIIPSEDVNVANDLAFCRNCNISHRLSALAFGTAIDETVDVNNPPAGAWFLQDGSRTVIGATHRSLGQAFGLLFFCLFWNGIVFFFVSLVLEATLRHLGVMPPKWFPAAKGTNMPLALTIFMWLFLTPFVAIGLLLLGTFLSCLAGQTELRIEAGEALLFTGVGRFGFRKRFSIGDVKDIRLEDKRWCDNQGHPRRRALIIIETGAKPINLGSMFSDERRRFVAAALKRELLGH